MERLRRFVNLESSNGGNSDVLKPAEKPDRPSGSFSSRTNEILAANKEVDTVSYLLLFTSFSFLKTVLITISLLAVILECQNVFPNLTFRKFSFFSFFQNFLQPKTTVKFLYILKKLYVIGSNLLLNSIFFRNCLLRKGVFKTTLF